MNSNLSIDLTDVSLIDIFNNARSQLKQKDADAEKAKAFTLRGGSAGCVTESGNFIGANPWETLARFMGYQTPKTRISLDIFDHGYANEGVWDKYLRAQTEYEVTGDSNYPLNLPNFVGNYPLTGRPDVVLLEQGRPVLGGELKVVAGTSSAEKVLSGRPKTENLCQAGLYSAGFGIPWVLAYTSYSNFKGRGGAIPPGKAEYFIGFDQGKLCFMHKGVITETVIDIEGIKEYYECIVAAYEAKNHSFFFREPESFSGEPEFFNPDSYNTFSLMVDCQASWGDWARECEQAHKSPVIIDYSTYRRQDVFRVIEHETMRVLHETNSLEDARNEMRGYWK